MNVLYMPHNAKTINVAYRSEYNNKCKKQVILLIITKGKKWHYLAITNLSAFFKEKLSNHKEHEEICNNHYSCYIEMPKWIEKILKYNLGEKSCAICNLSWFRMFIKKRTISWK